MKRLLQLEFLKLFWIQNNILFLAYIFISTIMLILKYGVVLESTNQPFSTTNALYLYNVCTDNFPALGKYLLIFMIINIGQESGNQTLAKNLMDGLSRVEYLNSKLLLVICLSLAVLLFELLRIVLVGVVFPFDFLELLSYFTLKDFVDPFTIILFSGISGVFIAIVFGKIVYGLIFYFILNFIISIFYYYAKLYQFVQEEYLGLFPQAIIANLLSNNTLLLSQIISFFILLMIFIGGSQIILKRKAL